MYPTSTVRSQVHNGYEASSTKANPASYPTVVPEKSSQFEPIDEKGSSFGRFIELCYVIVGHPEPEKKILLAFLSTFWHPCSKCILMCFKKDRGGCQVWKCP